MYNIFLVDRIGILLNSVLCRTEWNIQVLIVQDDATKEQYKSNSRIAEIYTATEFLEMEELENIDFKYYKNFRGSFHLCDSGMRRMVYDYQYVRKSFYMGLSVWKRLFDKYDVNFCLLQSIVHGLTLDCLMIDTAVHRGIPCYEVSDLNLGISIVYDQSKQKVIKRMTPLSVGNVEEMVQRDAYYFKDYFTKKKNKNILKEILWSLIDALGGAALYRIILCVKQRSLYFTWYPGRKLANFLPVFLENTFKWRYILHRNNKMAERSDDKEDYVVYFLHFEPEATVAHYATYMDSQLVVIKMLAAALPVGWKLYVKEHPVVKTLNGLDAGMAHFLDFYSYYNSVYFFDQIRNTENVKWLRVDESATELIKRARAVATIVGTVIMECILENKPCLVFGDKRKILYTHAEGVYSIASMQECRSALHEIQMGKKVDNSAIYKYLSNYFISNNRDGYDYAVEVIENAYEKDAALRCDGNE